METKKTRIPIVTEEIVDLLTKEPLVGRELDCTREEMKSNNPLLIDLLEAYIATLPKEHHGFAVSATVFAYHILRKQEEYDSGLEADSNGQLN